MNQPNRNRWTDTLHFEAAERKLPTSDARKVKSVAAYFDQEKARSAVESAK